VEEQVVVSVTDDRVADLAGVVAALRTAGLRVGEVFESVGVVTGTVDGDALGALSAVPGVEGVERSRTYRVPPPDSSVQ
jgi:hypothetical protein